MLELMTWNEIVDSLTAEGKLKKAAVFDLEGEKLAGTSGIEICGMEARGLIKCLGTPSNIYFSFSVEGASYKCFVLDENTMIGKNSYNVFVAHKTNNVLVCGFSDVNLQISCLGGVRNFASRIGAQVGPIAAAPSLI